MGHVENLAWKRSLQFDPGKQAITAGGYSRGSGDFTQNAGDAGAVPRTSVRCSPTTPSLRSDLDEMSPNGDQYGRADYESSAISYPNPDTDCPMA